MKLIVGLGNPGPKYVLTRHNLGFIVVDALAERAGSGLTQFKSEHKALTLKIKTPHDVVLLAKPQTYMNLSGESVASLCSYYNVPLSDLLIIHDEVDFPYSVLKFQHSRGHGGHNGIRSTHQLLGSNEYARLKMGVGRPPGKQEVADFLLSNFSKEEMQTLPDFVTLACEAVDFWIEKGTASAANKYNSITLKPKDS